MKIVTCKLVEYPTLGNQILKDKPVIVRDKIKITEDQMIKFNDTYTNKEYIEIKEEPKVKKGKKATEVEQTDVEQAETEATEVE